MAGEPPCYFFSYARKDWDKYLEKFCNEIERRIGRDVGRDPELLLGADVPPAAKRPAYGLARRSASMRVIVARHTPSYKLRCSARGVGLTALGRERD